MKNDEVECITDHPGFEPVCLNTYVLDTAYNQYKQQYNRQIQNSWRVSCIEKNKRRTNMILLNGKHHK